VGFVGILARMFEGLGVTGEVTLYGLVYAVPFAMAGGVLQYRLEGPARFAVTAVIEFWRSSSAVILLFMFFYVLPYANINLSAMTVSALVLGLNIGAYGSQAVRGALQAVDRGQIEGGLALGLARNRVLWLIELPQILRPIVPVFINLFIQLVKATALVSLVTLSDMTFRAKEINQLSYQPVAVYSALLLAYLLLCYPIAVLGRRIEHRLNLTPELRHGL